MSGSNYLKRESCKHMNKSLFSSVVVILGFQNSRKPENKLGGEQVKRAGPILFMKTEVGILNISYVASVKSQDKLSRNKTKLKFPALILRSNEELSIEISQMFSRGAW